MWVYGGDVDYYSLFTDEPIEPSMTIPWDVHSHWHPIYVNFDATTKLALPHCQTRGYLRKFMKSVITYVHGFLPNTTNAPTFTLYVCARHAGMARRIVRTAKDLIRVEIETCPRQNDHNVIIVMPKLTRPFSHASLQRNHQTQCRVVRL